MMTTEERYICAICARGFKHRRNMVYHERTHAGMLPFNCCGVGFSSRRQLQRHRCNVHGDGKNYLCLYCGKEFATKVDLDAHSAREQRTREIECEICNHKATTRAHLREHLKTHSEEKTHVCHVCKAAYKHISSLYTHYGQKHK
ncbi:hypothetical protein DPMN_104264 [Dreissena polymorpha]|uniref:C2H2-type domain-containing protein n=1 Tax=Dreissena polymorpha TaxID=45954 RepID=A0A9D4JZW7_DREPO|nr:hypothetical protein DPMN_104264 [Dreissena polymorpha]